MSIQIEFQIAGLIYILILALAFFKKVKWDSLQNRIYKLLLLAVFAVLILDIASVISINHRDEYPLLNDILAKAYLVAMLLYIFGIDCYAITCTMSKGLPEYRIKIKQGVIIFLGIAVLVIIGLICANTLFYTGYGRTLYSYGLPSDLIYIFSTFSVAFVIFIMTLNIHNIQLNKMFSILSFCIMEGIIAIVQLFNKELLLVGFGCSVTMFIMYFTVENPDAQTISRLSHANKRARELLKFYSTANISRKSMDSVEKTSTFFQDACVLSLDIVDFARFANRMGIERFSKYLSSFYDRIDGAAETFNIEKLKAVGTSYMAAAGIPEENRSSASELIHFAVEILSMLKKSNDSNGMNLQVRIGIANGPFVANLVGTQNFVYNAWSSAISFAERLQQNCQPNSIHVSEDVYMQLKDLYKFDEVPESEYEGLGRQKTWLLDSAKIGI
ncbi:MAG: adenylate/guanylate cyclase domain-containing protein [Treponema sp.]|nr:adenylate/guanylate cyclase domain-containing protein [Treponema sp.]